MPDDVDVLIALPERVEKVQCRSCGHPRSPKIMDETGRCNNCRAEIQRRWDHRSEVPEVTWDDVRAQRNTLVAESVWTVLPGSPLSAASQTLFAEYLAALHRVTVDYPSPTAVVWPTKPDLHYGD